MRASSPWTRLFLIAVLLAPAAMNAQPEDGSGKPLSMAAFYLQAWMPEFGTPQVPPDSADSRFLEIGRAIRGGRLKAAEQALNRLDASARDPRTAILVRLFRIGLENARWSLIGSGMVPTADFLARQKHIWDYSQTQTNEIARLAVGMAPDQVRDGNAALFLALNLRDDMCQRVSFVRQQVELSSGALPPDFAELAAPALSKAVAQGMFAGPLTAGQQAVLTHILDGRMAQAKGEWREAERLFTEGVKLAEEAGLPRARAFFLLSLGDLLVAPSGDALTFGYDLAREQMMGALSRRIVGVMGPAGDRADAIRRAADYYDRAYAVLREANAPDREPLIMIRGAYLKGFQRDIPGAAEQFGTAARSSPKDMPFYAALAGGSAAILRADQNGLSKSIALFQENGDPGGAASLAAMGNAWGYRAWDRDRDLARASRILNVVELSCEDRGLADARLVAVQSLANVYSQTGRFETAIEMLLKAVDSQEDVLRETQRRMASDTSSSAGLLKSQVEVEKLRLSNLLTVLDGLIETVLMENPVDLKDRFLPKLSKIETRMSELRGSSQTTTAVATRRELNLKVSRLLANNVPAQVVIDECNKMRPQIDSIGDPLFATKVDILMSELDPRYLPRARESVQALKPVEAFASALPKPGSPYGMQTMMALMTASMEADASFNFAVKVESFELLRKWLDELEALVESNPPLRIYRPQVGHWRAAFLVETAPPEKARDALVAMIEKPAVPWSPDNLQLRMSLVSRLIEVEATIATRNGPASPEDAERILLLREQLQVEQDKYQAQRSGVTPLSEDDVEIANLSRKASLQGTLSAEDGERLRFLRTRAELKPGPWRNPTLGDIHGALGSLPPRTVLLAYHLGERRIVLWRAEVGKPLTMHVLESPTRDIVAKVNELRIRLASPEQDPHELSRELYKGLVEPAGDLETNTTLIVLAPGFLTSIPFEALGPSPSRTLLFDHPVIYINYLVRPLPPREAPAGKATSAVVVAPVIGRLEFLQPQAAEVAAILGVKPLGEDGLTSERLIAAFKSARWIHIASDTVASPANPYLSYLAMPHDKRLELWQLFRDTPSAEVVVMSSCSTQPTGNPMSASFASPLLIGGVKWIVTTRWGLYDDRSRELMVRFYKAMFREGKTIAEALQQAKIALSENGAVHPHYYLPFILTSYDLAALRDMTPRRPEQTQR